MKFSRVFLTKGIGRCVIKDRNESAKLMSFEKALRDASIAPYNWVEVNSIFPPKAKLISREEGISILNGKEGDQLFYVCAKQSSNKDGEQIGASVGIAMPLDGNMYGYLSEIHSPKTGESEKEIGDRAEDLAATMLAEIMDVEFDINQNWDEKKEIFHIDGRIVNTESLACTAVSKLGYWTTVLVAAVLLPGD